MKKIYSLITGFGLFVGFANAQNANVVRCYTTEHMAHLEQTRPGFAQERQVYESNLKKHIAKNPASGQRASITIPVVVHVVYKTTAQNISDAQVQSQIEVLNNDFKLMNADTSNIPAAFKALAGNTDITFCMATVDPSGNPTSGINRVSTTVTSFTDDNVKSTANGGADAWDVSKYFNIWTCNLGGGLLGYAEFPTSSLSNTYGVVIGYSNFGNTGTVSSPYDGGRTLTHEIGHCFNLYHIWGDESACGADDGVSDTPQQKGENYGCPTYPLTSGTGARCNTSDPSSMFMNYMDYTDDACMNMFTIGQVNNILSVVNTAPYNVLKSSTACLGAGITLNASFDAATPTGNLCSYNFTPSITIRNNGSDDLTSCVIEYSLNGGSTNTYSWSGNLLNGASEIITLPSLTAVDGSNTVSFSITNPNNGTDQNLTDNSGTTSFNVDMSLKPLPLSEGFESATYPPTGWQLLNPDNGITWERTNLAKKVGSYSVKINNYDYETHGMRDALVTPKLDFTNIDNAVLTFYVAYKLYTDPTTTPSFSDTLEVNTSNDCGESFTNIYKKYYSNGLTTATPVFTSSSFKPTSAQWRLETVSLDQYTGMSGIEFHFTNITQYENVLWLDEINISGDDVTSFNSVRKTAPISILHIGNETNFAVSTVQSEEIKHISVTNIVGQDVFNKDTYGNSLHVELGDLNKGVYIIKVETTKGELTKRVVMGE